jgi:hypothetical protein
VWGPEKGLEKLAEPQASSSGFWRGGGAVILRPGLRVLDIPGSCGLAEGCVCVCVCVCVEVGLSGAHLMCVWGYGLVCR